MSHVYLVGAGPGDPDLITLKALKTLQKADVLLYDALANKELLNHCKESCDFIYVGKKPGIHQYQQIYINDILVECAQKYQHVVRLKGGDPFVFGRGHEELQFLGERGIPVTVVPGISSALAVPASCNIPVTHRGVNESFWVVTGTTKELRVSKDLRLAAQSSATAIILMGMKNLTQIIEEFRSSRGRQEPVAIIQHGTLRHQKVVIGSLANIVDKVEAAGVGSPAVIVIGEVVRLKKKNELSLLSEQFQEV